MCYINRWINIKMYFGSFKFLYIYWFLYDCLEGNLNKLNDFINDYFIYNLKLVIILIYLLKFKIYFFNGLFDL